MKINKIAIFELFTPVSMGVKSFIKVDNSGMYFFHLNKITVWSFYIFVTFFNYRQIFIKPSIVVSANTSGFFVCISINSIENNSTDR